ncbi:MAG TPA: Na+/H+ antiporter NhaA [Polyangia bacterium]
MGDLTDHKTTAAPHRHPPGSWAPARRLARRALAPVEKFLAIETSSGILLLASALVALIWANSPWRDLYRALWHTPFGLRAGPLSFEANLHFLINDGLMTVFFFVVGLEIRAEMHNGQLSSLRRAALPLAAAVGGMIVPAGIFAAINFGEDSATGWGIPMATDIAFAVGVLSLLGSRVPPALRILLLALAVIDDMGAILVIAIFYSSGLVPAGLAVTGAGLCAILVMRMLGVRSPWSYVPPAVVVWSGAYMTGIHPTLAGVIVGLLTPVRPWFGREKLVERVARTVDSIRAPAEQDARGLVPHLARLEEAAREGLAPVERIQSALHRWVAFGIMPLFALANAGVGMGDASLSGQSLLVFAGVFLGLALGKPAGVLAFSWLAARARVAELPGGVTWRHMIVMGVVAGIGFTMSIFISALAFPDGANLETSKIAILIASGLAASLAYGIGRIVLRGAGPAAPTGGG